MLLVAERDWVNTSNTDDMKKDLQQMQLLILHTI